MAIILPLLVLAGLSLRNSFDAEWETTHENAERIADTAMARFDRDLLSAVTLLKLLARSPAFDRRDYRTLYDRAKEGVLDRKGDILLICADDHVIFSTGAEFGADLPSAAAGRATTALAATPPQPFVTDLFIGDFIQATALCGDRARRPGWPRCRKVSSNDGAWRTQRCPHRSGPAAGLEIRPRRPPRENRRQQRSSRARRGADAETALDGAKQASGLLHVPADGKSLLAADHRSKLTGWVGYALIPLAAIEMPFVRIWREFMATGFSFLALSLFAAYLLSRRMTRPIDGLTRAATVLGWANGSSCRTPRCSMPLICSEKRSARPPSICGTSPRH